MKKCLRLLPVLLLSALLLSGCGSTEPLPDGMEERVFYRPTENGYEKKIKEHMEFIRSEAEES